MLPFFTMPCVWASVMLFHPTGQSLVFGNSNSFSRPSGPVTCGATAYNSPQRCLLPPSRAINNRAGCLCQLFHSLQKKQESYLGKLTRKSLPGLRQGCRTWSCPQGKFNLGMLVPIQSHDES